MRIFARRGKGLGIYLLLLFSIYNNSDTIFDLLTD